uniref:Uncharacterized protein n=1 Tax=Ditylenchus dipsaci TaxID=166011 RepID=A0A915ECF1_9BILA
MILIMEEISLSINFLTTAFIADAPSAVQVELCSNAALSSWSVVRFLLVAVRIYLKKPPESKPWPDASDATRHLFYPPAEQWPQKQGIQTVNSVVDCIQQAGFGGPTCLELLSQVTRGPHHTILNRPHQKEVYSLLHTVLINIDYKSKASNTSVVNLIINYILNNSKLEASFSLAELLLTFCALRCSKENQLRPVHLNHAMAVIKSKTVICSEENGETWHFMKAVSMLMWSASCIVWENSREESMRYDTIAVCLDIASSAMLKSLAVLAASPPNQPS